MEEETRKEFLELLKLLDEGRLQEFKEKASECPPVDIAEGLEEVEDGGRVLRVFRMLPKDISSDVFSYMTSEQQQLIAESATNADAATRQRLVRLLRDPGDYFARARREAQEHARRVLRERLVSPGR